MNIYKRIERLVRHYMRIYNTNNPEKIARALGIHIIYKPLGNALGYYRYMKRIKWIFINEDIMDNEALVQMVMAHELGHAILHWKENCCFMAHYTLLLTSKIERQANVFAANLLITDKMLDDYKEFTIEQFSNCTGIDKDLIELRLTT